MSIRGCTQVATPNMEAVLGSQLNTRSTLSSLELLYKKLLCKSEVL